MLHNSLEKAFFHKQNDSLMLLARSKQTIHALTSKVQENIRAQIALHPEMTFKVVMVNCTLNNSEAKMISKFCETLGIKCQKDQFFTVEMINSVQQWFTDNPNSCLLFLFEDIDYYVETTKQVLLYKILDMLTYVQIKFVFLATSMKLDVADGFEKRVKSRFSHRQVLLYNLDIDIFNSVLAKVF